MCLLSAVDPRGYSCACPEGIELDNSGRSCVCECLIILTSVHLNCFTDEKYTYDAKGSCILTPHANDFPFPTGSCLEAGHTACCTEGACYGTSASCYCDRACYGLEDCCTDIGSVCHSGERTLTQ